MSPTNTEAALVATQPPRHAAVRNLAGREFSKACAELLGLVLAGYHPDLLVGIRTGGYVVAEAMAQASGGALTVLPVTCRRAGTAAKSHFRAVLGRLPRPVLDRLRVMEHNLTSVRRRSGTLVQHLNHAEAAVIAGHGAQKLLVVDDAVDSGVTLRAVVGLLREVCLEGVTIRSAVVTVTTRDPLVQPDFALYRGVLCRFPWSFDAAN